MNALVIRLSCPRQQRGRVLRNLRAKGWNGEASAVSGQQELLARIRPGMSIEFRQGDAPPTQIMPANRVTVDLNVHHHCIRLLDPSDLSKLYPVAEPCREIGSKRIGAQVAG